MSDYRNISLEEVKSEFSLTQKNFNPSSIKFNPYDFRIFINGLFQAEGVIGVYFPKEDSLRVAFYFSIGQNYTPEVANIFLMLQHFLGGIGNIRITELPNSNKHIKFVVSNTEEILNIVKPYFSLSYGQKRADLLKLDRVYQLASKHSTLMSTDPYLATELIYLVYSFNPDGQLRKFSLDDKLTLFNCVTLEEAKLNNNLFIIKENSNLPEKLFILGFFLGDGSLGFVIDAPKSRAPNFYVKIVFSFATLKINDYNIHLLKLIAKSMELDEKLYKKNNSMVGLEFSGETVFKKILPFLQEHKK